MPKTEEEKIVRIIEDDKKTIPLGAPRVPPLPKPPRETPKIKK